MNPSPPHWYYFPLSMDAFRQGNDDAALLWAERIELPSFFGTDALLAAIYGQLGRSGDAAGAVDRLLTLYPEFEERALIELGHQQFEPAVLNRLVNGLRKAGLTIAQPATNTGQPAYRQPRRPAIRFGGRHARDRAGRSLLYDHV